ncbi:MAG: T9SS type A sorting domain-containing protein, partial [Candidatus Electryoneaceae bacterium]|nr:T9SS type A sorting domain-containing protein [Candidatus Electryoneaceae bacterium]
IANGVTLTGDYAYVANGIIWDGEEYIGYGLQIIDISDPESPRRVGYYDTPGIARSVALSEDGLIYVADRTNMGIYRFTDPAHADDPHNTIPTEFSLSRPYPNPFNGVTTIGYTLPSADNLSIRVYDLSGRSVATLFDGQQNAGHYTTLWNGQSSPTGVYLVKMDASEFKAVQKIILIK